MKRLRNFLLDMKPTSETYEEMYEGTLYETFLDKDPIIHNQALYWDGETETAGVKGMLFKKGVTVITGGRWMDLPRKFVPSMLG